jgi:hypothetical protein
VELGDDRFAFGVGDAHVGVGLLRHRWLAGFVVGVIGALTFSSGRG